MLGGGGEEASMKWQLLYYLILAIMIASMHMCSMMLQEA